MTTPGHAWRTISPPYPPQGGRPYELVHSRARACVRALFMNVPPGIAMGSGDPIA